MTKCDFLNGSAKVVKLRTLMLELLFETLQNLDEIATILEHSFLNTKSCPYPEFGPEMDTLYTLL